MTPALTQSLLLGLALSLSTLIKAQDMGNGEQRPRIVAPPTALEDVINSAWEHFPGILSARARLDEKTAEIMQAEGAFDHRVQASAITRQGGYYDGGTGISGGVVQDMPFMGSQWFADYTLSGGRWPAYQGQWETANLGEARIGIALSLLRDRDIDPRRFAIANADLEVEAARLGLVQQRVQVIQRAYVAYMRWLVSARLLANYEALLDIAEERGDAIARQVEAGDAPEILGVENQQAILQRQALVQEARRQLGLAAEGLSLFYRDDRGQPQPPRYDNSLDLPSEETPYHREPTATLVNQALSRRPDIAILDVVQEQLSLSRQLAENEAKPRVDLRLYGSRDLGNGPPRLLGSEGVADLSFSYPLQNRRARGQIAATDARIIGLRQDLRLLVEETTMDIRQALINLSATRELLDTARAEAEVAAQLAEAEQRRFDAGLSDFFLLNVRETTLAEAQLRRWQADLNHQIALAQVLGLSLDLEALGVDPRRMDGN